MPLEAKSRLGPYEILSPLGAGGMGEVFKARDTRLNRDVAIKVLPSTFSGDAERLNRFEREARAVAVLSHPNILAIYDVGEQDGSPFIVTELLEGETLRKRMAGGALPVPRATEWAVQIARGLAAAHEKGIVHRDLKPENIFVTNDGHVKILDFGLAKLARPEEAGAGSQVPTGSLQTGAGAVLGTVGYMSPEQVRGQLADARSDIFALGIVLCEMLSGQRPFERGSAMDTLAAILKEPPPPLPESLPESLDRIVHRCLEKRPEDRFQSTHDLAHDLGTILRDAGPTRPVETASPARKRPLAMMAIAAAATLVVGGAILLGLKFAHPGGRPIRSPKIVILPFENLGAPEDAYFAAGMTEEITSRLANVQGLGVISRTSAVGYDRRGKTLKQIGSDLGVDYVLEGSVRWERGEGRESRVRITPQLVRAADDTHVWSDRYDRVISDVFAMQSEVAENTVKAMGVTLLPREHAALKEVSTSDMEAYDLYLRGQQLSGRSDSRNDIEGALQMYQNAVDRDPRFAQALAGLARNQVRMYWFGYDLDSSRLSRAKEAAERAVELRPDLAETHDALAWYFYQSLLDYPRALAEFAAALKIQPNNSDAIFGVSSVLRRQGRWSEAVKAMGKAIEFDPSNVTLLGNFGLSLLLAGRYAEADDALRRVIDLNPQWGAPYSSRAWLQVLWHGDLERARAILDEARRAPDLRDDQQFVGYIGLQVTLARRDYPEALRQLGAATRPVYDSMRWFSPIALLRGEAQRLAGQNELARPSFETARLELGDRVLRTPDDARIHSSLGIACAGLGLREKAVREGKHGCDLMPASKDAMRALDRLEDLAKIYTMVGQQTEAIATLEDLLAHSNFFTTQVLRLEPCWDPLRSDPRFQALLKKFKVKP